jgi:hypothetical protein
LEHLKSLWKNNSHKEALVVYRSKTVVIYDMFLKTAGHAYPKPSTFMVFRMLSAQIHLEKIVKGYKFIAFSIDFFFLGDLVRSEMSKLKNKLK